MIPCAPSPPATPALAHPWEEHDDLRQQGHLCAQPACLQHWYSAGIHVAIGSTSMKGGVSKQQVFPPFLGYEGQASADPTLPPRKLGS